MSTYFNCVAYDDVKAKIEIGEDVIFLVLNNEKNADSAHLTLNPIQVHTLAKYLSSALSQIEFNNLKDVKNFGYLEVEIEKKESPQK